MAPLGPLGAAVVAQQEVNGVAARPESCAQCAARKRAARHELRLTVAKLPGMAAECFGEILANFEDEG